MDERRTLTIPNVMSLVRLLCAPLFLWRYFGPDDRTAALTLLAFLGATDWVDGWIARRFDQGSELGKVLDPVADRALLLAAAVALTIDGVVPMWVGIAVLAREAIISVATLALAAAGAARIDVQFAGKTGTFAVMFALPGFLIVDLLDPGTTRDVVEGLTWFATAVGLTFGYYATAMYVPLARKALRAGREQAAAPSTSGVAA